MYEVMKKESAPRSGSAKNTTGIPDKLKRQFETYSGLSFDGVKVHYNSDRPRQMQALAYTQADQVYIAPGQERHLGHELGHIVQKRRGQVRATCSLNGQAVNDNPALEKEADTMASHVSGCLTHAEETEKSGWYPSASGGIVQRKLNVLDFSKGQGGQQETTDDNVVIYQMLPPEEDDITDLNKRNFEQIQAVDEKKKIGMIFIGHVELGDFAGCNSWIVIGLKTRLGSSYYDTENEKSAPISYSNKMAYRAYVGEKAAKELLEKMAAKGLVQAVQSQGANKGNKGYKLSERWYIPASENEIKFSEWDSAKSEEMIKKWNQILDSESMNANSLSEKEKQQYNQLKALIGKFQSIVDAAQTAVFGDLQSSLSEAGAEAGIMEKLKQMGLVTKGGIKTWTVVSEKSLRRRIQKYRQETPLQTTFPSNYFEKINVYKENRPNEFIKQRQRKVWNKTQHIRITYELDNKFNTWTQGSTEWGVNSTANIDASNDTPYAGWSIFQYDGTNEERGKLKEFKIIRPAEIPHLHEKQDEIYKVTKGKMWLMVNRNVVCVEESSQKIIKRNTPHAVVAIEPPYQHLVIQYPSLFHEDGNKREVDIGTMEYFYQQCVDKKAQKGKDS